MKGKTFREPLFHSVVSGQKTQFREIINPQPDENGLHDHTKYPMSSSTQYDMDGFWGTVAETGESEQFKPRYKVGETVYLKEPYFVDDLDSCHYKYNKLDRDDRFSEEEHKWASKLFMPEKYARHHIEITGVRAERLQAISDNDCLKEGIVKDFIIPALAIGEHYVATYYYEGISRFDGWDTPRDAYAALIDEIHGKGKWQSNPFVWVYDFKLLK